MFQSKVISIKTRMTGLLVLSSLVHFYAFSFIFTPNETIQTPFTISANIVTPSAINYSRSSTKKETPKKPLTKEPVMALEKNTTIAKTITKKEQIKSKPSTQNKASEENSDKVNWFQVKGEIKSKIQQSFYYPRLAIRNNWQGTVLLSLTIDHFGKVTNHKVMQSSGFRVLDQAALTTISKIEKINISQNIQYYNPMNIELPVIFKLNEG